MTRATSTAEVKTPGKEEEQLHPDLTSL